VAGDHLDAEGNGGAARETIVLLEIDGFVWDLLHLEGPEHARDGEPHLALSDPHTRADTATNTEHPVVTLHSIGQVGGFGRGGGVAEVAVGVECEWVRVPGGIVVHGVSVQDEDGILGDELTAVGEVLRVGVGVPSQKGLWLRSTSLMMAWM